MLLQTMRRLDRMVAWSGTTRHILVDSRTPVNYEMVAPVVRAMCGDPRVRFSFTASAEPTALEQIYAGAGPAVRRISPARAALRRWDAYLTSDFMWASLPRGAVRIQMFHGVAGKYGFDAPHESMAAWDRLFFVNERRLRNFISAGAIPANSTAPRLIGMPKVDCLVDGSLDRDTILGGFGLDAARPTVLYAPTWSSASSLNRMGEELVRRLLQLPINLIVKLHDRSRDPRPQFSGGIDWTARLSPLLDRTNALLAGSANITPYLAAADAMITDHSSAGFEYLLLDRPLVRIEIPELIEQATIHQDYVRLMADAGDTVRDVRGATTAVERALANRSTRSATRRAVAEDLFYRAGTATARCAEALYEVIGLAAHPCIRATSTQGVPAWSQSA
jgi:CDP-glycerol glycerophosphotransferase (TagB/SpsB family)